MNPNHYLSSAIDYLLASRPGWSAAAAIGKTAVTSAMIDRVAAAHGRAVFETPVGLKWFVAGLTDGSLAFAGEESAGATFARQDGSVWTTDKDGLILGLLAAEMTARTGEDPHARYRRLDRRRSASRSTRGPTRRRRRRRRRRSRRSTSTAMPTTLAGDAVTDVTTTARGNGASLGGVKVSSARGWFAGRPSGTENVVKVYAESFVDAAHLGRIQDEAQAVLAGLTA